MIRRVGSEQLSGHSSGSLVRSRLMHLFWIIHSYRPSFPVTTFLPKADELMLHKNRRSLKFEPWRRAWQPTPICLPGEPHGQRSLVGYTP